MGCVIEKAWDRLTIGVLLLMGFGSAPNAQDPHPGDRGSAIGEYELDTVIQRLAELVEKYYVSHETALEIKEHILSKYEDSGYSEIADPEQLARTLTEDLRSVNGDLHMGVYHRPIDAAPGSEEIRQQVDPSGPWSHYGLTDLRVLKGNIGYLRIRHFTRWANFESAKRAATAWIHAIQESDALIIDLRDNGGGFEQIVAYWISYFFEGEPIHLTDFYTRYNDKTHRLFTSDVPGKKLPDLPVFLLVNRHTASAGESFAYRMKHLGRATLIGETTAGAGYGALIHRLSDRFTATISSEVMINAVTKTSFEATGVEPNVKVASAAALETGYRLALQEVRTRRRGDIHPSNYEELIPEDATAYEEVAAAVHSYLEGVKENDWKRARGSFHGSATMRWVQDGRVTTWAAQQGFAKRAESNPLPIQRARLEEIHVTHDLADARLSIDHPGTRLQERLQLLRVDGQWKIIAAASTMVSHEP